MQDNLSHPPFRPADAVKFSLIRVLTLIAICWAIYGQSLGFDFLPFDDYEVYNNPVITAGLSLQGIGHFFSHYVGPNWFPLNWISHMTVYELFGPEAWSEHLANVFLHTCNTLLLYLFLMRATGCPWRSWLAAGLFAAHPLHAESVAWISERKDVLSACFFMLTLLAYERYARNKGLWRYILVFSMLLVGLMAKSMLVTMPCVLLLLDFWPFARIKSAGDFFKLLLEKIPFFILSLVFSLVAYYGAKQVGTIGETVDSHLLSNLTNALASYFVYLKRLFLPFGLAFFYPHPGQSLPLWKGGLALAGIATITLLTFRLRRSRPYILTGWLWFLGMLVPVIGIVQPGLQGMADRYAYLPFIGLYMALVWLSADLTRHNTAKNWKILAACLVLVFFSVRAWEQARTWRSAETLAVNAIAKTRNNYVAHMMLMSAYGKQGKTDQAKEQYELAREISPYYVSLYHEKHALSCIKKDNYDGALKHYKQGYTVHPTATTAYNLGVTLEHVGKREEAREMLRKALEFNPKLHQAEEALQRLDKAPQYDKKILFKLPVRFPEKAVAKAMEVAGRKEEATQDRALTSTELTLGTLLQTFEENSIPSRLKNKGDSFYLEFSGPENEEIIWTFQLKDNALLYTSGSSNKQKLPMDVLGNLYGKLLQLHGLNNRQDKSSRSSQINQQ